MAHYAQPKEEPAPNRPVDTLRDDNLKASIWRNEGENGVSYSTTFVRTWRDDQGQWHDSQSYSGTDMLRLGELSRSAYHRTNELRQEHKQSQTQTQGQSGHDQGRKAFEKLRGASGSGHDPSSQRHR
ncbi:hypothetical protein [uncultured Roseobacter sp.]|uniref:hypothetical protein n=1 Tax=uncultured Roseobacter sp. TaxID=114847 RepID=UPI0026303418|nr:hypothetical protein [uncultured Roseobacter sp.]